MKAKDRNLILSLAFFFLATLSGLAQTNHVANPSFEDITDCNIGYGEVEKAVPWKITGSTNSSPDIFHTCADEDSFYGIPQGFTPNTGDGMAGYVSLFAEEKIYARLTAPLPTDHSIYLSFTVRPQENTDPTYGTLCYSNTHSMAFSDNLIEFPDLALSYEQILDDVDFWTKYEACYNATGEEVFVFLGNYQNNSEENIHCDNYDNVNFTYTYIDDVIVAPFDVVPDTLILCVGESHEFNIEFDGLTIKWDDEFAGGRRTITEGGIYYAEAISRNCLLRDKVVVIKIPDQEEIIEVSVCEEATTTLRTPVPAIWDDGTISTARMVSRPGNYSAELLIDCEEESLAYIFEVTQVSCGIEAFVPNAFSPNGDGINDELKFYFNSLFNFAGELLVFDRWGNQLFQMESNDTAILSWDGTSNGKPLNPGVYLWIFQYQTNGDNKQRVLSGDVTIIR